MNAYLCVIIAVFRPNDDQIRALFASLHAQSRRPDTVVAVISDCASAKLVTDLAAEFALPLVLAEPDTQLDAVRGFELGLSKALTVCPANSYFALCDQDDIWHPDRLERGAAVLDADKAVMLVHSDARVVDDNGALLAPSLFRMERRLSAPSLRDLLYRNTVTGMTTTLRRSLVELALPFPRQSGVYFYHDLWLALLAQATGKIALIPQPLVDYRQHAGNVMGAVNRRRFAIRRRIPDANWARREAASYGLARYLAQSVYSRLSHTGSGFAKGRAGQLRPYLARLRGAEFHLLDLFRFLLRGNIGLTRLAAGQFTISCGRLVWALRRSLTLGLSENLGQFDSRLYSLAPGVQPPPLHETDQQPGKAEGYIDQRKEPKWTPRFERPSPALCILVPTLNPSEIFAGIATAVDIGLELAANGLFVRFIATDLPVASTNVSMAFLKSRLTEDQASRGAAERISLNCGVTETTIAHNKGDRFLATAWWSAFVAQKLIDRFGFWEARFHYLIQDFEPNFYSWGTEFADAMASYDKRFIPIFNTSTLRDYFAAQGFIFARPDSLVFGPSIDIGRYAKGLRPDRGNEPGAGRRKIAFYGRPEVARNMFATGVEALSRFVEAKGLKPEDVEIVSVGLQHAPIELANGVTLTSLGKLPYEDYPRFLLGVDIGLSLMLSPHPSHPPIEMAASGARVVTNSFSTKDLSSLTPAILSAPPDADRLIGQLEQAWDMAPPTDADRRIDLSRLGPPLPKMLKALTLQLDGVRDRPPVRRIILHIGAPKCGSTFLQRVLLANQKRLAAAGIHYPHDGSDHPGNAPSLTALTPEKIIADLGDAHTLIYSHEDLLVAWRHAPAFKAITDALGLEVQIVTFLRPFNELIFGTYSQTLKQRLPQYLQKRQAYDGLSFEEFAQTMHNRFRFERFLTDWQASFPGKQLLLAPHQTIRQTIERLLNGIQLDWTVQRNLTNPSLRIEDCDAIAAAIADPEVPEETVRTMFRAAHARVAQADSDPSNPDDPDKGRSPERIALVEAMFVSSYQSLATQFGYGDGSPAADISTTDISAADPAKAAAPEPQASKRAET